MLFGQRTEGGRYDSTRDEDWVTLASLESAISTTAKVDEGQMKLRRRLSLTTLVIVWFSLSVMCYSFTTLTPLFWFLFLV
jgi:hypothetical protein